MFYPGDIRPRFREVDTGQYRVTEMTLGSHSGTHIDAPSHYLEGGQTVDQIPPTVLIGPAQVLDCTDAAEVIRPGHLAGRYPDQNTSPEDRFSGRQEFQPEYPPPIGRQTSADTDHLHRNYAPSIRRLR